MNPDGSEYDIESGSYKAWRKNRQPNAGSSYVGTDLNRNWAYEWGCCGGSSGSTSSDTYRGPSAESAPEVRVVDDFVRRRVVGGEQQISTAIDFHTHLEAARARCVPARHRLHRRVPVDVLMGRGAACGADAAPCWVVPPAGLEQGWEQV